MGDADEMTHVCWMTHVCEKTHDGDGVFQVYGMPHDDYAAAEMFYNDNDNGISASVHSNNSN